MLRFLLPFWSADLSKNSLIIISLRSVQRCAAHWGGTFIALLTTILLTVANFLWCTVGCSSSSRTLYRRGNNRGSPSSNIFPRRPRCPPPAAHSIIQKTTRLVVLRRQRTDSSPVTRNREMPILHIICHSCVILCTTVIVVFHVVIPFLHRKNATLKCVSINWPSKVNKIQKK